MKVSRTRLLTASLGVAFAVTSTFTSVGAGSASKRGAPPDCGRFVMPFGLSLDTRERLLSFEDELDEEEVSEQSANTSQLFVQSDTEKAWLLEPTTFNRLSSAGQRAVLRANGLLRGRDRRGQPISSPATYGRRLFPEKTFASTTLASMSIFTLTAKPASRSTGTPS